MNTQQYRRALPYPRFSYEPLRAWSIEVLCDILGVRKAVLFQWMQSGLSLMQADRTACALGVHPYVLWPEWYDVQTIAPMKSHAHKKGREIQSDDPDEQLASAC